MSDISLSTAEAISESPIAPGQEALLDEFIAEQQAEAQGQEDQKILGKFNSPEELARAYQELERKLGQPRDEASPEESSSPQPKAYTREEGVKEYGEFLADKFEEAQFNPFEMAAAYEAGQDIEPFMAQLEGVGIPRPVVERYLAEGGGNQATELSENEIAEMKDLVGGEESFTEISQWAAQNLSKDDLADYNDVVNSGNKAAIRWALRALQQQAIGTTQRMPELKEPELVSSGKASATKTFESQAQVLEAMNKIDSSGRRLYDVDEAYRSKVVQMLAASDVFG